MRGLSRNSTFAFHLLHYHTTKKTLFLLFLCAASATAQATPNSPSTVQQGTETHGKPAQGASGGGNGKADGSKGGGGKTVVKSGREGNGKSMQEGTGVGNGKMANEGSGVRGGRAASGEKGNGRTVMAPGDKVGNGKAAKVARN